MRVAIPHMGKVAIPFKAAFEQLEVDYIIPPVNNQQNLSLGVKYSPEGMCLPFKLTLGNMMESVQQGADTLLMAGGYGICRLGYYAATQQQILHDLGYDVEVVQVGVSERKLGGLLDIIKRISNNTSWHKILLAFWFGLAKMRILDRVEREVMKIRPVEKEKGLVNRIYKRAVEAIDKASSFRSLRKAKKDYLNEIRNVDRGNNYQPLVVGVSGEIFVVLDPFANMDIEVELGKLGVEVRRRLFISDWAKFSFFLNSLGINETARIHRAASPYLKRDIGGEGWETVGEKVLHAADYDGLIHLAPFTCMPEIVAENIMPATRESIPVLTILCDEQATKTGVLTRLEAFVDLLQRRRRVGNN